MLGDIADINHPDISVSLCSQLGPVGVIISGLEFHESVAGADPTHILLHFITSSVSLEVRNCLFIDMMSSPCNF